MIGLDLLGLGSKHWNLKATLEAIKQTPDDFAIGCFDDAPGLFGDPRPNLRKILQTHKVKYVRVQLTYDSGHDLVSLDWIKARAPLWEKFRAEFPDVSFFISHTTEHYERNVKKLKERMELIKKLAPSCVPVNNPEPRKGALVTGQINETHKGKAVKGSYFVSMDGLDCFDINIPEWHKAHARAALNFVWCARFNLNDFSRPVPAPANRKAAPSLKHHLAAIALAKHPGVAPSVKATVLRKPWLYKPLSQDTHDNREGKPLLIVPEKGREFQVITKDGDSIGTFAYFGGYPPALHRYYSGHGGGINLWGYEIAERAKKVSGSEWIWLKQGKRIYGPVHPAMRWGYYR